MSEIIPEGAGNALTKKIGPLPGIVWVALIAGVVWLVYLWRKRGAAAGNSGTAAAAGFAPSAVGFSSAGPAPGTNNYSGTVSTTPVGQPATSTNAVWAKNVADFLIGTGSYSPSDVQNAISGYLSGGTLTDQQTSIVNTAIKQFQTPPEGVLPVNKQTITNDYTGHDYTVQKGDTLYSIIQKFYGNQDPVNIGAQGRVIAAGNNLMWDPTTGSHPVQEGQTIRLYADAMDIAAHQPDSFHWTGQ